MNTIRLAGYPEELAMNFRIESGARLLGRRKPEVFVVGHPLRLEVGFENTGSVDLPLKLGFCELKGTVEWANGLTSEFTVERVDQTKRKLAPGERVTAQGHATVVAPGPFSVLVAHPYLQFDESEWGGRSWGVRDERTSIGEWVAEDMTAIRQRRLILISLVTLGAVILGLVLSYLR